MPLSESRIREALDGLDTGPFGRMLRYDARTGSTNDTCRRLAESGAPEGTLVIADYQTAGRGRMGRTWSAPAGSSLLLSILFRPTLSPDRAQRLVMACGLAAADACRSVAGVAVDVKWPNDLQVGGRKLAGILPESALVGNRLEWVVVGLGLNVSQVFEASDPLAETATSLRMITGQSHSRVALLSQLLVSLNGWHRRIEQDDLLEAWRRSCVTLGQRIRVSRPGGVRVGLAEAVDETGALWLRDDDGERHRLVAGEATLDENTGATR